jgi:predicted GNAT superfamily acetyltransferase
MTWMFNDMDVRYGIAMTASAPRAFDAADLTASSMLAASLLALNNANARELSWLEPDRLAHLVSQAFLAACVGDAALLLAFAQDADYDSPNFLWFRDRYERFVYVDRVVVMPAARGRGLARRLYQDLFDAARRVGHPRVVCEVNSVPPNPVSDAFHAAMGFSAVGLGEGDGGKIVRYLVKDL